MVLKKRLNFLWFKIYKKCFISYFFHLSLMWNMADSMILTSFVRETFSPIALHLSVVVQRQYKSESPAPLSFQRRTSGHWYLKPTWLPLIFDAVQLSTAHAPSVLRTNTQIKSPSAEGERGWLLCPCFCFDWFGCNFGKTSFSPSLLCSACWEPNSTTNSLLSNQ